MKLLDYFNRKKTDRIKNTIRRKVSRYYIKKNAEDIKRLQETSNLIFRQEKKELANYYEERIKLLQEKVIRVENDNKFLRNEYRKYSGLLEDLEQASGGISMDNLHKEVNRIFMQFNRMKDVVEIVREQNDKRKIIGIK